MEKIAGLYGTTKSSRGKKPKGVGVNDCRPPYTTEAILKNGADYNSSEQLDFPFQLCYQENEITIEYTLTAHVYSTSSMVSISMMA
ncbi:11399_t:CDS:2 [Entrophospora sp. SA101]|nr:11399_t:CDS:2 [Entrophospora sp. SA101]